MICIKYLHLERFTGNETWQYLEKLCSVQKKKKKGGAEFNISSREAPCEDLQHVYF